MTWSVAGPLRRPPRPDPPCLAREVARSQTPHAAGSGSPPSCVRVLIRSGRRKSLAPHLAPSGLRQRRSGRATPALTPVSGSGMVSAAGLLRMTRTGELCLLSHNGDTPKPQWRLTCQESALQYTLGPVERPRPAEGAVRRDEGPGRRQPSPRREGFARLQRSPDECTERPVLRRPHA